MARCRPTITFASLGAPATPTCLPQLAISSHPAPPCASFSATLLTIKDTAALTPSPTGSSFLVMSHSTRPRFLSPRRLLPPLRQTLSFWMISLMLRWFPLVPAGTGAVPPARPRAVAAQPRAAPDGSSACPAPPLVPAVLPSMAPGGPRSPPAARGAAALRCLRLALWPPLRHLYDYSSHPRLHLHRLLASSRCGSIRTGPSRTSGTSTLVGRLFLPNPSVPRLLVLRLSQRAPSLFLPW